MRTQLVRALELLRRKLPGGFVAGLAALTVLDRAVLADVRRAELTAADAAVPSATIGAATTALTLGGLIMGKKILFVIPALILLGGAAAWLALGSDPAVVPRSGVDGASGNIVPSVLSCDGSTVASAMSVERVAVAVAPVAEVDPLATMLAMCASPTVRLCCHRCRGSRPTATM